MFRVQNLGFKVQNLGCRVQVSEIRVWTLGAKNPIPAQLQTRRDVRLQIGLHLGSLGLGVWGLEFRAKKSYTLEMWDFWALT